LGRGPGGRCDSGLVGPAITRLRSTKARHGPSRDRAGGDRRGTRLRFVYGDILISKKEGLRAEGGNPTRPRKKDLNLGGGKKL